MLELGQDAGAYHQEVGAHAASTGIGELFALGAFAEEVVRGAHGGGLAHAAAFADHESLAEAVVQSSKPGDVLLVKGSRGLRMEKVIEALERIYGS
jgi:UDP-N-acetylmuramoyl-tripeptide--D-alanyl-D-alanine ligase